MRSLGFTITELMIVLVLGSLAVAIASPPLARAYQRTATQTAADKFVSTHSLARSAAIRFGRTAELHIDEAEGKVWVEVDTSFAGGARDTVGILKDMSTSRVTITSDRSILCFDARGMPTSRGVCEEPDASLTFSSGAGSEDVQITAFGRIMR